MSKLEEMQVAEKPWQLRGEVGAKDRPTNSLLEAVLDFDQATKLPPQQTEEETRGIDEIIKGRVRDAIWDDVIRKQALKPNQFRPKAAELSTDKSDKGLAEEYEAEFSREVLGHKAADAREGAHKAVREAWERLSHKLDALSAYTPHPKPHRPELSVKPRVAAVQLEDALPTAMATASGLAPEELFGAAKTDKRQAKREELSQAERKALRRKKKRVHRRKAGERAEQQRLRAHLNPKSATAAKLADAKVQQELADAKRRGKVKEGPTEAKRAGASSDFSHSAKFFRSMQEGGPAAGGAKRKLGADQPGGNPSVRFKL